MLIANTFLCVLTFSLKLTCYKRGAKPLKFGPLTRNVHHRSVSFGLTRRPLTVVMVGLQCPISICDSGAFNTGTAPVWLINGNDILRCCPSGCPWQLGCCSNNELFAWVNMESTPRIFVGQWKLTCLALDIIWVWMCVRAPVLSNWRDDGIFVSCSLFVWGRSLVFRVLQQQQLVLVFWEWVLNGWATSVNCKKIAMNVFTC